MREEEKLTSLSNDRCLEMVSRLRSEWVADTISKDSSSTCSSMEQLTSACNTADSACGFSIDPSLMWATMPGRGRR
jgi:hypothetical protein